MSNVCLGKFTFNTEPTGKLSGLAFQGLDPFLASSVHREEMAPGFFFEARGWDECFPTIEQTGDFPVMGSLVWNSPRLEQQIDAVCQHWAFPSFSAERRITSPAHNRLASTFKAVLHGHEPLPFLWASHILFAFDGLCRVDSDGGFMLEDFSLDGSSSKSFVKNNGALRLVRKDCIIKLETDQPFWGVWCNRGGWPASNPAGFGALGLEATNAESDSPAGSVLESGQIFSGIVNLEVLT